MAGARGSVFYALFGRPSDRFMRGFTLPLPKACALLLLLGGFGNAVTASAADAGLSALGAGYTAHDAPLGDPTELRIDLRGDVPARCRLASPPVLGPDRTSVVEGRSGSVRVDYCGCRII